MSKIDIPLVEDFRNRLFEADYELLLDINFGSFKSGIYGVSKELNIRLYRLRNPYLRRK